MGGPPATQSFWDGQTWATRLSGMDESDLDNSVSYGEHHRGISILLPGL
jgi:hypothetical protein